MRSKGKISQSVLLKSKSLLDVDMTTNELAAELNVTTDFVRKGLIKKYGAPFSQDKTNRIWINGKKFKLWVTSYFQEYKKEKVRAKLADNEFYCVKCHAVVTSEDYSIVETANCRIRQSICPVCSTRINRFLKKHR